MNSGKIKICIACSTGGHMLEAKLATMTVPFPRYYVTFYAPHLIHLLSSDDCYFITMPNRNIFKFILNFWQSFWIFIKEKPDVVISTGADVAFSTCLLGRIFGAKVIFIESASAIDSPSLTGRLVHHIANLFIVPWQFQLKYYKKGKFVGDPIYISRDVS